MRKAVFVLGTPEWRAVQYREMLMDWTFNQLDDIARRHDLDASIVFAVSDTYWASKPKTVIGIERIRAERQRVLEEISLTEADIVIAFGPVAAACLLDHGSMTESKLQRRRHMPFGEDGPPMYYTSSIEQIKMAPGMVEWWDLDIAAALRGYDEPVVDPWSLNKSEPLTDTLKPGDLLGFDLETTGLNPWASNAAIRMMVLSWRTPNGIETHVWDWDKTPSWAMKLIDDQRYVKVGANIGFDVKWCARFGVEVNNYVDVLTMEHVLCPGNPRLTLKDLGFKYFPQVANYNEKVYELAAAAGDDWSKIPAEEMYEYCAADGQVSLVTAEEQFKQLLAESQNERPGRLMRDLYPLLTNMTVAGAVIDEDTNLALEVTYESKMTELRAKITQILGPINLNSPNQLAKALKSEVPGIDLSVRRLKRAIDDDSLFGDQEEISTDRQTLERESGKHPVIALILEYRKYRTRHSTFVTGLREKHMVRHHGAAWIHPDFRSDVTDTYRLSSRSPNGQNMPRNDTDPEYSVKRQFVSRFEGGKILEIDMSQIELRVAAWFSGDMAMQRAFEGGGDIHREMAAHMLGKEPADVTDEERQSCKTRTFLIMYGGGANKLAQELKISRKQATALINEYFKAYPQLKRTIDEVHRAVKLDLSVTTPFGFRRQFFPPDNWISKDGFRIQRQSWNTIIQNTAACLMYCAMIRFSELWDGPSVPILQIHDSLVVDCVGYEVEDVAQVLLRSFREAPEVALRYGVDFTLPIEADIKIGDNWGQTTKFEV